MRDVNAEVPLHYPYLDTFGKPRGYGGPKIPNADINTLGWIHFIPDHSIASAT